MNIINKWILKRLIRKSGYALPVLLEEPPDWTREDEAWLRHTLNQRAGRKLIKLLLDMPLSLAMDGRERSAFENGKVAGAALAIQTMRYLTGQPELDVIDDDPPEEGKTL